VKDYKNTGRSGREEKYKQFSKCGECGGVVEVLHHIDSDNKNDDISNLQGLCIDCHHKKHMFITTEIFYSDDFKENLKKAWIHDTHRQVLKDFHITRDRVKILLGEEIYYGGINVNL
jgi:hypothetical protein